MKGKACTVSCGVPQGSNLGPLFFLIYLNDISKLPLKGKPRLFADDTAISYKGPNAERVVDEMTQDMELVTAYLENNLLALNLKKTKMMIFSSLKCDKEICPDLVINGTLIEKVTEYEYLGVYIDERLSWDFHIRTTVSKCSSLCGILRKLSKFVPAHVLMKIYYSFIHSRYQYGIAAWGSCNKVYLKPLQIQQNRCIKSILS